jgi:23S rRNA (adenine2503-C2)-methyltransferase
MDLQLLQETLAERGEPPFRARQVWRWAASGAQGFAEMTDLPAALRAALERQLPFSSLRLEREQSARDGTVKALFATADGLPVEAVLMRYRDPSGERASGARDQRALRGRGRRSVCLSSQSGCPLTCRFCATGSMRFGRNLTSSEIVDEALHFRRIEAIDHCVFMGMGEPMLNLDAVLGACERLPEIGITHRRTTISTVGWIPGIETLTACQMPLRLAVSLHAPEDALRSQLMPINDRYPLVDVIAAAREFHARRHRRVFIEYVMLAGVNDRYEQALALAALLAPPGVDEAFKVNLIPFNPSGEDRPGAFSGSSRESMAAFRQVLLDHGVPATLRLTRGRDIAAACGQLAGGGTGAQAGGGRGAASPS